jgi:Flp pilus assembly protein TadD
VKRASARDEKTYGSELVVAYRRAADHYSADGDLTGYLRCLQLAVDESPESAELHYLLGNALYEAGRKVEASRHWRLALELEPDHPDRSRMLELIRVITSQG